MIQHENEQQTVYTIDISDLQADLPWFGACTEVITTTTSTDDSDACNVVTLVDPNTLEPAVGEEAVVGSEHVVVCDKQIVDDEVLSQSTDVSEVYTISNGASDTDMSDIYTSMLVDADLADAVEEAVQSGKMTPILKKELVFKIQHKRLQNGQEEIDTKELGKRKAPTDDNQVNPEDQERKKRRRDRNRLAAQRCRSRKKELAEQLEDETDELMEKQENLKQEINDLEQEKANLMSMLRFHDASQATKCGKNLVNR